MTKEEMQEFIKNNLRIRIKKGMGRQYSDDEYDNKLEVSLYMIDDNYMEIEVDSDSIDISNLINK